MIAAASRRAAGWRDRLEPDTPQDEQPDDPDRAARKARREWLKATHPDTGGSGPAFQEAMRRLSRPKPLQIVFRPRRPGVPGVVQDLARDLQATRFRRRRTRVD